MKRGTTSLSRLDALIVKTEQRIAEQVIRIEAARYGALASRLATCRLADLRVDLLAYRRARDAVAEAGRGATASETDRRLSGQNVAPNI